MGILHALTNWIAAGLIAVGLLSGAPAVQGEQLGAANPVPQTPALYDGFLSANIGAGDTSMTISPGTLKNGSALSGFVCFTIDVNLPTVEYVCGTASGTNVTGMTRGVDVFNPNASSASLAQQHRRYGSVSISDYPTLQFLVRKVNGTDPLSGILYYDSSVTVAALNATSTSAIPTIEWVNAQTTAGAPNASETVKGIAELGTALETASSTSLGGTGARLVIPSSMATDTPQSGCAVGYTATAGAGCSVIAQLTGKIRQTFLGLSEAFTWTGAHIFSALVTFNGAVVHTATTTIPASNILNNAFVLNSVPYRFPTIQATASSTALCNDASGNLTWCVPSRIMSGVAGNASASGAAYASTTVMTIPAGLMNASSTIDFRGDFGISNTSGAARGATFYLRTSTGITLAIATLSSSGTGDNQSGMLEGFIGMQGSTASQKTYQVGVGGNQGSSFTISTYGGSTNTTIDFSSAVTLVIVAQGNGTNMTATWGGIGVEVHP